MDAELNRRTVWYGQGPPNSPNSEQTEQFEQSELKFFKISEQGEQSEHLLFGLWWTLGTGALTLWSDAKLLLKAFSYWNTRISKTNFNRPILYFLMNHLSVYNSSFLSYLIESFFFWFEQFQHGFNLCWLYLWKKDNQLFIIIVEISRITITGYWVHCWCRPDNF